MATNDNILSGDDVYRMTSPRPLPAITKHAAVRLNTSSLAGLQAYETWLGGQAGGLLAFLGGSNGADDTMANIVTGALGEITTYAALNRFTVWTFFPCSTQPGEGGLNVIAGQQNAYIDTIFTALAAAVPTGDIWVRSGHECNFWSAYPWGAAFLTPAQFVALDQYVKNRARLISDRFKFVFCPNWNVTGNENLDIDPRPWFSGIGYNDAIMPDMYMLYSNVITGASRTIPQAINYMFTAAYGVNFYLKWTGELGLPFGFSEWGFDDDRLSGLINRVYQLADEYPLLFWAYWDKNSPGFSCRISDGTKVQAEAAYRPAFKGAPVAWTSTLEFGQNLYHWNDYTDAATITNTSGAVASITNKGAGSPGAAANATAGQRPTITTRNSAGAAAFDGGDDNLVQTVMSSFIPNMNEEKSMLIQGYLDPSSTSFKYFFSEADVAAAVGKRSIGVNAGVLRSQAATSGVAVVAPNVDGQTIAATTGPVINTQLKGVDASVILLYGPAHDAAFNETIQTSINGSWLSTWNRRHVNSNVTPTKIVQGCDAGNSGAVTGYAQYTMQHSMGVNYRVSQRVADRWSGGIAWSLGLQASLRADHPNKNAAPTYGM